MVKIKVPVEAVTYPLGLKVNVVSALKATGQPENGTVGVAEGSTFENVVAGGFML